MLAIFCMGLLFSAATPAVAQVGGEIQPATLVFSCVGGLDEFGGGVDNFRIRLVNGELPGQTAEFVGCELVDSIVDCEIDLMAISETEFDETTFDTECDFVLSEIVSTVATCIDMQVGGSITGPLTFSAVTGPGGLAYIRVEPTQPMYFGLCSPEISLDCMDEVCYPLSLQPIFNLGDGERGNENAVFLASGIGVEVVYPWSPRPTPTITSTPTPTNTPTSTCTATPTNSPTNTPTPTFTPGCDAGYYLLLANGSLDGVGNIPDIVGDLNFGFDLAQDLSRSKVGGAVDQDDLAVLDGTGIVHFAESEDEIMQDFIWPTSAQFPQGRAVDFQMTRDFAGFWVLTDFGGIYRAGSAKECCDDSLVPGTDQFGVYGYDVPMGDLRWPVLPQRGASLRCVAFIPFDFAEPYNCAEGYLILDSMGGHMQIDDMGEPFAPGTFDDLDPNHPWKLLESGPNGYEFPFFRGYDIARDMDILVTPCDCEAGVVIYDGFGGIHPVPVNDPESPVFYTRNEDPDNPGTQITTVGMPYLTVGMDDPETPDDESNDHLFGADVASIYVDFDFSRGCNDGFYVLDRFGNVYAFGAARSQPDAITPDFGEPIPLDLGGNVVDIEFFAAQEYEGGEPIELDGYSAR